MKKNDRFLHLHIFCVLSKFGLKANAGGEWMFLYYYIFSNAVRRMSTQRISHLSLGNRIKVRKRDQIGSEQRKAALRWKMDLITAAVEHWKDAKLAEDHGLEIKDMALKKEKSFKTIHEIRPQGDA